MAIVLKILCFSVWMIMMVSLIIANRRNASSKFRRAALYLDDEDELEMYILKGFYFFK